MHSSRSTDATHGQNRVMGEVKDFAAWGTWRFCEPGKLGMAGVSRDVLGQGV